MCAVQLDVECCAASLISFKHPALGGHAVSQTCGMQMCAGVKTDDCVPVLSPNHTVGSRSSCRGCLELPVCTDEHPGMRGMNAPPTQVQREKPPRSGETSAPGTLPHSSPSSLSLKHFLVSADFLTVCQNHTASVLYGKRLMSRTHLSLS